MIVFLPLYSALLHGPTIAANHNQSHDVIRYSKRDLIPYHDTTPPPLHTPIPYLPGYLRKKAIFGGNATGDPLSSLPSNYLGVPSVECTWSGMRCCVPMSSVPVKHKKKTISMNGLDIKRCEAIHSLNKEELCVSIKFNGMSRCRASRFVTRDDKTGNRTTTYGAVLKMPGKMNNAVCECSLTAGGEDPFDREIEASAEWEVNIKSRDMKQVESEAAGDEPVKLKGATNSAAAWTHVITNGVLGVTDAMFGDNTLNGSSVHGLDRSNPATHSTYTKLMEAFSNSHPWTSYR